MATIAFSDKEKRHPVLSYPSSKFVGMSEAFDYDFDPPDQPGPVPDVPNPVEVQLYPDSAAAWTVTVAPGPATAGVLAQLDPALLSQAGRVDALMALDRLQAWAAALQIKMITALVDDPCVESPAPKLDRVAVTDTTRTLDDTQAREVEQAVLPDPAGSSGPPPTLASFHQKLRRAADKADPHTAQQRAARAAEDRDVWVMPQNDGMAFLGAPLPAEGAATVMAAVHAKADQITEPDDSRTKAQRRADGLVQLCADYLAGTAVNITGEGKIKNDTTPTRPAPRRRGITGWHPGSRSASRCPPCSGWTSSPVSWTGTARSPRTWPAGWPLTRPGPGAACSPTNKAGWWTTAVAPTSPRPTWPGT